MLVALAGRNPPLLPAFLLYEFMCSTHVMAAGLASRRSGSMGCDLPPTLHVPYVPDLIAVSAVLTSRRRSSKGISIPTRSVYSSIASAASIGSASCSIFGGGVGIQSPGLLGSFSATSPRSASRRFFSSSSNFLYFVVSIMRAIVLHFWDFANAGALH